VLQQLVSEFKVPAALYRLDVRDAAGLARAADEFRAQFGTPDVVIANAGVSAGTSTERAEDRAVFQEIMDVNVIGMVNTFHPFIPAMRIAARGTLVGIASVAGFRGLPGAGAYSASKAAAIAYLESLRVELRGSGISVVTICPGYIATPMTENNPYPMPFIMPADGAARRMAEAVERRKRFVVIPWQMGVVGAVLKVLPRPLYDRLLARAPRKPRRQF
jgi:NAD(P)-dependent dehydrogenase (short-subunit alcohol dehydrogenase family)